MLLGAALITAALGHWIDTGVIVAVVLTNTLIGFIQEGKAERTLDAIRHMLAPTAHGLRGGERAQVAGIAMGRTGSEAAREAAELVLTDDNFASIVAAVREGRTVYDNLTKVISFILPINGGESVSLIVAPLMGLTLPIAPVQILWVNMIGSTILAMTLAFEPPEPQIMQKPPRGMDQPLLNRFVVWRILFVSALFAVGIFGQFELALYMGKDLETARTIAVNTLIAMEVFYLFSIRYVHGTSLTWRGVAGTPPVLIALGLVTVAQLLFIYAPFMQRIFGTAPLSLNELLLVTGSGVALFAIIEIEKRVRRRKSGPF
ncbi:MAG: cation transporting ATPase C-terminal domain-containing protein [Pseudomonadota bacterium]